MGGINWSVPVALPLVSRWWRRCCCCSRRVIKVKPSLWVRARRPRQGEATHTADKAAFITVCKWQDTILHVSWRKSSRLNLTFLHFHVWQIFFWPTGTEGFTFKFLKFFESTEWLKHVECASAFLASKKCFTFIKLYLTQFVLHSAQLLLSLSFIFYYFK